MSEAFDKAKDELERAISNFARTSRDEEVAKDLYVTDFVLVVASESMSDSNTTYFNYHRTARVPKYVTRGLLSEAMAHYKSDSE